jgi:hypothetical protein
VAGTVRCCLRFECSAAACPPWRAFSAACPEHSRRASCLCGFDVTPSLYIVIPSEALFANKACPPWRELFAVALGLNVAPRPARRGGPLARLVLSTVEEHLASAGFEVYAPRFTLAFRARRFSPTRNLLVAGLVGRGFSHDIKSSERPTSFRRNFRRAFRRRLLPRPQNVITTLQY